MKPKLSEQEILKLFTDAEPSCIGDTCGHRHTELLSDVTDDDGNVIEEYGCWDCGVRFFREADAGLRPESHGIDPDYEAAHEQWATDERAKREP